MLRLWGILAASAPLRLQQTESIEESTCRVVCGKAAAVTTTKLGQQNLIKEKRDAAAVSAADFDICLIGLFSRDGSRFGRVSRVSWHNTAT